MQPTVRYAASLVLVLVAPMLWYLLWLFANTDLSLRMRVAQIIYFLSAFAVFCLAVAVVWRLGHATSRRIVWFIIAVGILMRLSLAPIRPVTTSDIYRYLWEGRVINQGYNPFSERPDSPELAVLHDQIWSKMEYKNIPAAYPPVA